MAIKATKPASRQNMVPCPGKEKTANRNLSDDRVMLEARSAIVENGEMEVSDENESREKNCEKNDVSEMEDLPNANDGAMEIEHERECLDMNNEAVEENKRMNAMPAADGRDEAPVGNDEERWWENGMMEHQDEDESGEGSDHQVEEWKAIADDKERLDIVLQSKYLDNADHAQDSAAKHKTAKVADGSSFPQRMKAGGVAEAGKMVSVRQATAISRAEESTRE